MEYKGRLNTWALFLTDDYSSNTVTEVYENASCDNPGQLLKVVLRRDKNDVIECETNCCRDRKILDSETIVEGRVENADASADEVASSNSIGDVLLWNLGTDTGIKDGKWSGKIKGNLRSSLMKQRALYGDRKYRFLFTDVSAEYKDLQNETPYSIAFGRQSILAGVLVDGVSGNYYWGSSDGKEDRSIGLFGGLAPSPITKDPNLKFTTFGANLKFIPDWSRTTETKLRVDSTLVTELYKGKWNRFYLFSRAHFTPVTKLSFLASSTLELPAFSGDDKNLSSSNFSLQSFYRPNRDWFLSLGFTQFRINRYLAEESVRWLTDENSYQSNRVGETLDRSHRYRVDFRASYRPIEMAQPFVRVRLERRTFDGNKTLLNQDPATPDEAASEDLRLLDKKNAYGSTFGLRLFPLRQLETETSFSYQQRYLSKYWEIQQNLNWDSGTKWTADAYFQLVSSERSIQNSISTGEGTKVKATDYYLGVGGSYKILSDLLGQIRYDFSCEEDYVLGNSITIHSLLARLDYRF